jgi:hypothetical protein
MKCIFFYYILKLSRHGLVSSYLCLVVCTLNSCWSTSGACHDGGQDQPEPWETQQVAEYIYIYETFTRENINIILSSLGR